MKPPICEICNEFFDPDDGALVRFAATVRGERFAERQRTERVAGHPPDDGWFCGAHVMEARTLAAEMSLGEAMATMRGERYFPPEPESEAAEPTVKSDDLGVGYRIEDIDGSGAVEWPIEWLGAADIRTTYAELAPVIARAFGGPDRFELVETHERRSATVDGQGPDDDPWVDTIQLRAKADAPSGRTTVRIRHTQKHLSEDSIINVQVDLSVKVITADGHRRNATLAAWGYISDDLCNRLRLTGVDTGPVVESIRVAFGLGTDRWNQRRDNDGNPICLSCGEPFIAETGGRTFFKPGAAGMAWNERLANGEAVGRDRPYDGWFCTRHIGPASLISDQLTRMEAMPLLVPEGRSPLEYREHPEGIAVRADKYGEPGRAPFKPVSLDFDPQWSSDVAITPQAQRDVDMLLARSVRTIGTGLGVDHLRGFGTNGAFSSYQSNDVSVFLMSGTSSTLILQRREQTMLEIEIRPSEPVQFAPDDAILMERLEVRAADAQTAEAVQPEVEALIALLIEDVADPFDLSPDLAGVDLLGAELQRGFRGQAGFVRWDIEPIEIGDVATRLRDLVTPLAALLGVDDLPELVVETKRNYTPMDGAMPPDCPYDDLTVQHGTVITDAGEFSVECNEHRVFWNPNDVANVSASVRIALGEHSIRVSSSGQGATCTSLMVSRPVVAGVIDAIASPLGLTSD